MAAWNALVTCLALVAAAGCIQPQSDANDAPEGDRATTPSPETTKPCEPPAQPPSTPGVGPEQGGVSNQPGSFTYGGQTAAKTGTETYVWENPGMAAQVTWGGQSATGIVRLVMHDACGQQVYEGEERGPGQGGAVQGTNVGEPGAWTLTFEFTAYTGQMGLSITTA